MNVNEYNVGYEQGMRVALCGLELEDVEAYKHDKRVSDDWVSGALDGYCDAARYNTLPPPADFDNRLLNKGTTNFYEVWNKILER